MLAIFFLARSSHSGSEASKAPHLPLLLDSMGVSHASFCDAFSSKHDVFLKSLDLYCANIEADLAGLICESKDSESAVAALIDGSTTTGRSGGICWDRRQADDKSERN